MIINGTKVEGTPKVVEVKVAGKDLKLTLVHIGKDEKAEATFKWNEAPEGVEISTAKVGNRVASTIKANGKVVFECLTAQSVFAVLEAKFGWSTSKSDSVYKKSNPTRKEAKAGGATKVVLTGEGVF